MSEPLLDGEFEVARHGAWWARVRRVEVKAIPGRGPLFFWRVGHDSIGPWLDDGGGFRSDIDSATETALARFERLKDLG